jgi:hypothetical protein
MYFDPTINRNIDRAPSFGPFGELYGKDGAWNDVNDPARWMFAGLFTVQVFSTTFAPDTRFLMACDVMESGAVPSPAALLPSDEGTVAARCGASVAVFSKNASGHRSGTVTIPDGVALVILANLQPGQRYSISAGGGLSLTTPGRTSSAGNTSTGVPNALGRLLVSVSGAGTMSFS